VNCGGASVCRALELIDHLAFGHLISPSDGEANSSSAMNLHLDLAEADFAGEGMVAAIAALGGIAERQQEAFIAARQILQAQIAAAREAQRLAREIARLLGIRGAAFRSGPRGQEYR
jgi:hypothetical protein